MIEGIQSIGKKLIGAESGSLLENLTIDLPSEIKKAQQTVKQHLVIIDYRVFDRRIELDIMEIDADTKSNYLWIGTADGSRSPQIYFTSKNLEWLLSKTLPNLLKKAESSGSLKGLLELTLKDIFLDLSFSGEYRYILDGEKTGIFTKKSDENYKKYLSCLEEAKNIKKLKKSKERGKKEKESFKELLKTLEAGVYEYIHEKKGLAKKEIGLFTLKINGRLMVDDEEYRNIAVKEKIESLFGDMKKICSGCNELQPVTEQPTKFAKAKSPAGYYITDKIGFSSELSGRFYRNFALCKDCYKELLSGEVFVRNNLASNIGGLNLFIIPKFLFTVQFNIEQLDRWAGYIQATFNSAKSIRGLQEFESKLGEYKEFDDIRNNFILYLLFYRPGTGNETKVLKLIKDVPPTRLYLLKTTGNKIKDIGDRLFGESSQWYMGMENIYYLIPLRKSQNTVEYRKLLGLYDAIFSGKPVSERFLIDQFIELAQVYRFEKFDAYNIGKGNQDSDIGLVYAILKANLFLLYLKNLNLLKGGEKMDTDSLQLDSETKDFINEMGYDEAKTSMFLLGCLIGEIGNAQYSKGKSKPILGKIIFQGMNKGKLKRLANEVFEKLIEYKRLSFNEKQFAECKRLMDKQIDQWPLSDQDNVFYVLSGYAYATHKAIKAGKTKEGKKKEGDTDGGNKNE